MNLFGFFCNFCNAKQVRFIFFLCIILSIPFSLYAQSSEDTEPPPVKLKLDFPFFDFPYQKDAANTVGNGFFGSYARPSLNQTLAVTTDAYSLFALGMKQWQEKNGGGYFYNAALMGGAFVMGNIFGLWLHEESHRAVLTAHGVDSDITYHFFNYTKPSYASVKEDARMDYGRFARENPSGPIRVSTAGLESQILLVNNLQRNNFFYEQDLFFEFIYWEQIISSHHYIIMDATGNLDAMLENVGITTGGDPTHWASRLFSLDGSDEDSYEADMDKYLKSQMYWHILNYVSPMLFGIRSIKLGDNGLTGNFAMRHLLTPFGTAVSAQVFLKKKSYNMAFAYHSYLNYEHYFPAIEAELIDYPLHFGKFGMYLSPRFIIGMQPKEQKFKTKEADFFGLFGLRVDFMIGKHFFPYIDFTARTDGWAAGDEYLTGNETIKIGVSLRF